MTFTRSGHTGCQEGRGREAVSRQSRQRQHSPGARGRLRGRAWGQVQQPGLSGLEASLSMGVRVSRDGCMATTSRLPRGTFIHSSRQSRATLPSRGLFLLLLNH